jgi:hypothetical protein
MILGKTLLNIKYYFDFFLHMSVIFLILRIIQPDIIIKVHASSRKVPFILTGFLLNFTFLDRFLENPHYKIS